MISAAPAAPNHRLPMKARILAPIVLAILAGTRVQGDAPRPDPYNDASARQFSIDLLVRQATEQSEREQARKGRSLAASDYDLNRDGKLDEKEMAAWQKGVRAAADKSPACLARFDQNHDGKLDDAEWAACWQALIAPTDKK